jgi:hypothetical protein
MAFPNGRHADRVCAGSTGCRRERTGALPQSADPHRCAVWAGRLRRRHRPSGAEVHRTHQRAGGDREPSRCRRNHRRQCRHLGAAGRLHPVRILERHGAVEVVAQIHAVRSGHRVRTDHNHGAVRPAAAGQGGLAHAHAEGCAQRRRRRSAEIQHRHHQSGQHPECHRRTVPFGRRHSDDGGAAPHFG